MPPALEPAAKLAELASCARSGRRLVVIGRFVAADRGPKRPHRRSDWARHCVVGDLTSCLPWLGRVSAPPGGCDSGSRRVSRRFPLKERPEEAVDESLMSRLGGLPSPSWTFRFSELCPPC